MWTDALLMLFGETEKEQEGTGVRCGMGLRRKPSSDLIPVAQGDDHKSDLTCRMEEDDGLGGGILDLAWKPVEGL